MDIDSFIQNLKRRVRKHGRYDRLSEATGLSASFLSHFAGEAKRDYNTASLRLLQAYFATRRKAVGAQLELSSVPDPHRASQAVIHKSTAKPIPKPEAEPPADVPSRFDPHAWWKRSAQGTAAKAAALGIEQRAGESWEALRDRIVVYLETNPR